MKKNLSLIFCFVFVFFFSTQTALGYAGGTGTQLDPYQISTCTELQDAANDVESHFRLINNIDCSESAEWNANTNEWVDEVVGGELIPDDYGDVTGTDVVVVNNGYYGFSPIGTYESPFVGTFDGNDYTISNVWIFRKDQEGVGIFGYTQNAEIFDLSVIDSDVVGANHTGALAGYMYGGAVDEIYLSDNMVRAYFSYGGGGLVGYALEGAQIQDVDNVGGTVHGSGAVIGGIVGLAEDVSILRASSGADVDGGYDLGGLVGRLDGGSITDSSSSGMVHSDRNEYLIVKTGINVGGLVGYVSDNAEIIDSNSSSYVRTSGDYAGGLVGSMYDSMITNSFATGLVEAYQATSRETTFDIPESVGGFIGQMYASTIQDSYATGDVTGADYSVGGFVGRTSCESFITRSYAAGSVEGIEYVGGFVGLDSCEGPSGTFNAVAAFGDVTGTLYTGGFAGALIATVLNDAYALGNVVGGEQAGGFAGIIETESLINRAFSKGAVSVTEPDTDYGFANVVDSEVTASFYDATLAGDVIFGGATPLSTVQMTENTDEYTSAGWSFDGSPWSWYAFYGEAYPYFGFTADPEIIASEPENGAVDISPTQEIAFLYAGEMDTESTPIISTSPCFETCQTYDTFWASNQVLVLTPSTPFVAGETYTIEISDGQAFNGEVQSTDYEVSFTISSAAPIEETEDEPKKRSSSRSKAGASIRANASSQTTSAASSPAPVVASTGALDIKSVLVDLDLGMTNANVRILQEFLISQAVGTEAAALAQVGATGYFGNLTQAALAAWQKAQGITPAAGYFGPITRAYIQKL